MHTPINNLVKTRQFLLEQVKDMSVEALNQVPTGFNNNIIWHLGHLIATQQGICYIRSGATPVVDVRYITEFKNGTIPQQLYDAEAISAIGKLLITSLELLNEDVDNGNLNTYQPWTTRYGVEINNIQEAISFLGFHEGLHAGSVMAFKRLVH